jgi:hypothetical protein
MLYQRKLAGRAASVPHRLDRDGSGVLDRWHSGRVAFDRHRGVDATDRQ